MLHRGAGTTGAAGEAAHCSGDAGAARGPGYTCIWVYLFPLLGFSVARTGFFSKLLPASLVLPTYLYIKWKTFNDHLKFCAH